MPGLFDLPPFLFAQNAAAGAGANQGSPSWTFLPFVAVIALWVYLLLFRPMQKQDRMRRELIGSLKKNDRVVTAAGIYGTVVSLDEGQDRVVIRVDDDKNVRMTFTKASIVRTLDANAEKGKGKERASDTA